MSNNAHFKAGLAKIKENQFPEAIELLTKAIIENPKDPFIYNHRAVAYLNLEQYELSMFDMNMSIQLNDTYAYFYTCRGFLKARIRDAEGAVSDYEKSLELDPTNEITYNNLGLVFEQMGSIKRAKSMYEKGNAILGYDPEKRELNKEGQHVINEAEVPIDEVEEFTTNEEAKSERKKLAKDVFSNKKAFKEFLGFIGNGFKLKKDDKGTES